MSIESIQTAIVNVVASLVKIEATYTYPVADVGRKLPALIVVYDSVEQRMDADDRVWAYDMTLFLPADGKRLEHSWGVLTDTTQALLDAFNADRTLGGACWNSYVESGEAIINTPPNGASPRFIGHTFRLFCLERSESVL